MSDNPLTAAPDEQGVVAPVRPRLLVRNVGLNFVGQLLPLLVGLLAIPFVVRGLGTERFGLLALAWVIVGYFTVFDLGLGRATTKYVAELVGRGDERAASRVVWTSVVSQLFLGLVGTAALLALTPFLVDRVLQIPGPFAPEASGMFTVLSLGIPLTLVAGSLFGALEARQRFDWVNAIRVPASVATFLLPLVGIAAGMDLPGIVGLVVGWRVATIAALLVVNIYLAPEMRAVRASADVAGKLLRFGAWVTVSSVVGPILVYLDRFLIGSLVSIAAVAYYAAPYEAVTRLWIVPWSAVAVLFPALSALAAMRDHETSGALLMRSVKFTVAVLAPIVLMIVVFAQEGMTLWLGKEFAVHSAAALQILAVGVLVNSLALTPFALVQASGRPDLTAKVHLAQLPPYLIAAFFLVREFGITGAAWAWTLRVTVDAAILFAVAARLTHVPVASVMWRRSVAALAALVGIGLAAYIAKLVWGLDGHALFWALAAPILIASGAVIWRLLLDEQDRRLVIATVRGS